VEFAHHCASIRGWQDIERLLASWFDDVADTEHCAFGLGLHLYPKLRRKNIQWTRLLCNIGLTVDDNVRPDCWAMAPPGK
jgi:hypothetical protein